MSYLAKWVSEVKEGHTITAADVEVLARVQQALLASDKHHQQARDAQANVAEKLVVTAAVDLADSLYHYESHSTTDVMDVRVRGRRVSDDLENLRAAVAHMLAVEAAS